MCAADSRKVPVCRALRANREGKKVWCALKTKSTGGLAGVPPVEREASLASRKARNDQCEGNLTGSAIRLTSASRAAPRVEA